MSSRRKRKALPDWVGESYDSASKADEKEDTVTGHHPAKSVDHPNSSEPKSSESSSTSCVSSKEKHNCGHQKDDKIKVSYSRGATSGKSSKDESLPAEEIIRLSLPLLKFEGSLIYSYNQAECSLLCEELISCLSAEDTWHVGVDMEWPVDYTVGTTNKVALIQICTSEDKCYLFHIAAMGTLPKALKTFLSHSQVIKYGINIEADFWKLERDFDIQVRNVIRESVKDLGKIANVKLKSAERWTLDGLTRNVFRKRLDKEESIRCGRWDHHPLSEEQIQYAAADAYASFLLASHLRNK